MAHDVIMPALGMAQNSGVIVNWLKAAGDAVAEGDPLMEVETDKAVMEVQALASGFLVEIVHPAGADVPVGEVIARIGTNADAVVRAVTPAAASVATVETAPPATAAPASPEPARKAPAPPARTGKVLASPKTRRLAEERGIDLRRLVEQGLSEPLHAADLDRYVPVPAPATAGAALNEIVADVSAGALQRFSEWVGQEAGVEAPALLAALAASALARPSSIRVEHRRTVRAYDLAGRPSLSALVALDAAELSPDLVVRDLRGSRISRARLAGDLAPVLTLTDGDVSDRLTVTLTFTSERLNADDAFALIDAFAARVENPMRLLL
ncbi:biotin/lipoyl-containing protein [Shinella sp.]|uniref:biotin/lipoyl-containing protein n=1 Tax=Shinella sp. TaxID=1870904 RepID=UPI003F707822